MALKYLYSGAVGTASGADWTNAFPLMANAANGIIAGDTLYVAHDHDEANTGNAQNFIFPGTMANPNQIICVNRSGSVPPAPADLRTTANITVGISGLVLRGSAYIYGIHFNAGIGASANGFNFTPAAPTGSQMVMTLENCVLIANGSSGSASKFAVGTLSAGCPFKLELINTPVTFGLSGDGITMRQGVLIWRNTPSALPGVAVSKLLNSETVNNDQSLYIQFEGVDFTGGITATGNVVGFTNVSPGRRVYIKDCKLPASTNLVVPIDNPTQFVEVIRSDSGATNYRHERHTWSGNTVANSSIVRTGGASDGLTNVSWKIITKSANISWPFPMSTFPMGIWNDTTTGNLSITVFGAANTMPNNADIWLETSYLGSGGSPLSTTQSNGKANILSSNVSQITDSSTWSSNPNTAVPFKMTVNISGGAPSQAGLLYATVKVAKPGTIFFVDPKLTVASLT